MRVVPAIDLMDGRVVRLYRGDPEQKTVYSDDPESVALEWQREGADMLHIVDLDATLGRGGNAGLIEEMSGSLSVPVQVAGGLRSEEAVGRVLSFAARAVVGTMAFEDRAMLEGIAGRHGRSRIVISADHRDGLIVTRGWQQGTGVGLLDAVQELAGAGFAEFLLTSVGRDGTMEGPDLEYLGQACGVRGASVIASGGISSIDDVRAVKSAGAAAVILGRAMYEGKVSVREAVQAAH